MRRSYASIVCSTSVDPFRCFVIILILLCLSRPKFSMQKRFADKVCPVSASVGSWNSRLYINVGVCASYDEIAGLVVSLKSTGQLRK
jgi:hypothetical protein